MLVLVPVLQSSGCALYAYMCEDGLYIGRNFDWLQGGGAVEFVHPGEKSPEEEMFDAMNKAYVENTVWTSIYNLNERNITLAIEEERDTPIKIGFEDFMVYHKSVDFGELKMRFTNPFNH